MKKFITAAALLAAGTALASAADPTSPRDTVQTVNLSLGEGKTVLATVVFDVSGYTDIAGKNFAGVSEMFPLFYLTGTYDQGTTTGASISRLGLFNGGSTGSNATGLKSDLNGKYNTAGPGTNYIFTVNDDSKLVCNSKEVSKLAASYAVTDNGGTTRASAGLSLSVLYTDGTAATVATSVIPAWLGSSAAGQGMTNFNWSSYSYDADYVSSVSVTKSSEALSEDMLNAASLAAVPEPSAFGLLAGAGALALVAARRRRKA